MALATISLPVPVGPSTNTGLVDINTIPQQLISRVDVVTGGATFESWFFYPAPAVNRLWHNEGGRFTSEALPGPEGDTLTLLFTVREESGLFGARHVDPADLGRPVMGFNFDGRSASEVTIGAVGAERWEVDILGKAAHAGVASMLPSTGPESIRMISKCFFASASSRRSAAGENIPA